MLASTAVGVVKWQRPFVLSQAIKSVQHLASRIVGTDASLTRQQNPARNHVSAESILVDYSLQIVLLRG
jgi:hypothetical protein